MPNSIFMRGTTPFNMSSNLPYYIMGCMHDSSSSPVYFYMASSVDTSTSNPCVMLPITDQLRGSSHPPCKVSIKHNAGGSYSMSAVTLLNGGYKLLQMAIKNGVAAVPQYPDELNNIMILTPNAINNVDTRGIYPGVWYDQSFPGTDRNMQHAVPLEWQVATSTLGGSTLSNVTMMIMVVPATDLSGGSNIDSLFASWDTLPAVWNGQVCTTIDSSMSTVKWFLGWSNHSLQNVPHNCDTLGALGSSSYNCYFADFETCSHKYSYPVCDPSSTCGACFGRCPTVEDGGSPPCKWSTSDPPFTCASGSTIPAIAPPTDPTDDPTNSTPVVPAVIPPVVDTTFMHKYKLYIIIGIIAIAIVIIGGIIGMVYHAHNQKMRDLRDSLIA